MKITEKIKKIYSDHSIIIKDKVTGLFWTQIFIIIALSVTITGNMLTGQFVKSITAAVSILIMVYGIFSLSKGRYRIASLSTLITVQLAFSFLSFKMSVDSSYQVMTPVIYMFMPVILTLLVSFTERATIVSGIIGLFVILLSTFIRIVPSLSPEDYKLLPVRLMTPLLIYIFSSLMLFYSAKRSRADKLSVEANDAHNKETIKRISNITEDSSSTMEANHEVQGNFQDIKESADEIKEIIEVFTKSTSGVIEDIESAINALDTTLLKVTKFDSQVEAQNLVVAETTAAVNQMGASLNSAAETSEVKRALTGELLNMAIKGQDEMKVTLAAVDASANDTEALLQVNNIISDIAERTNLLSMNAAIEAAHAGESGKGFAVVADEIRKLAGTTAENSDIISNNLNRLKNSMENSKNHTERVQSTFIKMVDEIRDVLESFEEIARSNSELSSGGLDIMKSMNSLQNSSSVIKEESEQVAVEQKKAKERLAKINNILNDISDITEIIKGYTGDIMNKTTIASDAVADSTDKTGKLIDGVNRLTHSGDL